MKYLFTLFIFFAAISCKKDIYSDLIYEAPDFKDSITIKATVINDTIYTRGSSRIFSYKDYLVLFTPMDDYAFQLFNKGTGQWIKNFGEVGRGPEQILKLSDININEDEGILTSFIQGSKEIYVFYLDSVIHDKKYFLDKISLKKYDKMTFDYAYKCKNGFLLGSGKCKAYPESMRYSLFSEKGELTATYDQYPFNSRPASDSVNNSLDWILLRPKKTFSPDGSKLAEASEIGGVLQILHIGKSIESHVIKGFYKPDFAMKDDYNIVFTSKTRLWTTSVSSSNHHIYVLPHKSNTFYDQTYNRDIHVFDWEGNAVRKYKTDQNIVSVCADEEQGKLYILSHILGQSQTLSFIHL
ncbi:MAG: TolB-like 6-bladed beta-propeller domain-containing protein [Odoribacter sp.]|nr:TolB-like 6-bladed beta-propeller domain-containing protein [Odoribacter sp.]